MIFTFIVLIINMLLMFFPKAYGIKFYLLPAKVSCIPINGYRHITEYITNFTDNDPLLNISVKNYFPLQYDI